VTPSTVPLCAYEEEEEDEEEQNQERNKDSVAAMSRSEVYSGMDTYDFVVIGGGSAGYSAASTAVRLGLNTLCVDGGKEIGGLCILRGCMPSKTLIESANRFLTLRRAEEFGLSAGHVGYDAAAIIARKRRLIGDFSAYRAQELRKGPFEFERGSAEFVDPHTVRIRLLAGGERIISAKTAVIATGSTLNMVDLPGLKEIGFLHSDLAVDSDRIPKSVVLLGGGAIALEFAHFYEALGTRVTILQRSSHVLKPADSDVADAAVSAFRHRGIDVICGTNLLRAERAGDVKRIVYEKGGRESLVEAEEIFYALGRRPLVDGLNLDAAGVKGTESCPIQSNAAMQTSQPHIFVSGDATGMHEVVHIAIQQAAVAARNARRVLKGAQLEEMDYRLKLFCIFSEPQIAMIGLTEKEASERGLSVRVARYRFDDHGKSMIRGETDGFVKLIVDAGTGEIVGGAIVGPEGAELIHEISVAMHFRATAATLAAIPHYHPTLSEIWTYPAEELAL
jgi:pyruvate/2-oxoglutarate dehydrogenase complex dihydrolipoamide dehydrogenase (E3) component